MSTWNYQVYARQLQFRVLDKSGISIVDARDTTADITTVDLGGIREKETLKSAGITITPEERSEKSFSDNFIETRNMPKEKSQYEIVEKGARSIDKDPYLEQL